MIVRTHMTAHPITLRLDSDLHAAIAIMHEHAIHHLPVLGSDERIVGIVAERDLLLAALRFSGGDPDIGQVMHRNVVSVRDDAPITHAATLMARNAIGGLPVVDARDRVVGIITERDIFRAFVGVLEAKTARENDLGDGVDDEPTARAMSAGRRVRSALPASGPAVVQRKVEKARTARPKSRVVERR